MTSPLRFHAARISPVPSVRYRRTAAPSTARRRPTSSATDAKTADEGAASATSVATAPQRCLLLGYSLQLLARLCVGQRGCDQLAELKQTVLAAQRHRPILRPSGANDPPQAALRENGRCGSAAVAERGQLVLRSSPGSLRSRQCVRGGRYAGRSRPRPGVGSPSVTDGGKQRHRGDRPRPPLPCRPIPGAAAWRCRTRGSAWSRLPPP